MTAKWLDVLFVIAEAYKAGDITEAECRDRLGDVLDLITYRDEGEQSHGMAAMAGDRIHSRTAER